MSGSDDTLSLVLFSGTDDKLTAAAVLAVGAVAMGRSVNVFLQYWALDAFRADQVHKDHGVTAEAGPEGAELLRRGRDWGHAHWSELLAQAKELGQVSIQASSLSMEMFGLTQKDLDPMVDGVEGVAAFMSGATGPIVFV